VDDIPPLLSFLAGEVPTSGPRDHQGGEGIVQVRAAAAINPSYTRASKRAQGPSTRKSQWK